MAARRSRDTIDERDFVDVRVHDRDYERQRNPLARYFEEDRRSDAGALVLRQRHVETLERTRSRHGSPSPTRYREVIRGRPVSPIAPPRQQEVDRIEIRDRDRYRELSRGPPQERVVTRIVERERERSPTPPANRERERVRVIEHSYYSSPSPSPPPLDQPRPVIRGPIVERDVITHYTDVDHGVIYDPRPPPPPPEPVRERETEIDVYKSPRRTHVDIRESTSRERRRSPSRSRLHVPPERASERDVVVRSDRNYLEVDVDTHRHRRSHSAQPYPRYEPRHDVVAEEAQRIETRIDDRGEMGEAYHGATKSWTIVDVPPGTERVRMDGVGGGSAEVTWQRYNGVRRTKFIPNGDENVVVAPQRKSPRPPQEPAVDNRSHVNVQIIDKQSDYDARRPPEPRIPPQSYDAWGAAPAGLNDMWTEITRDIVTPQALQQLGYDFTVTEYFIYVPQYLSYNEVQQLVDLTARIRWQRQARPRSEIDIDVDVKHRHRRSHSHHRPRRDDSRYYGEEIVVDHRHQRYYR